MSKEDKQAGILPPRDQRRLDPVRERHGKSKKDTKRWCRGKEGQPHLLGTQIKPAWLSLGRTCQSGHWLFSGCYHEEYCTRCGKVTKWMLDWKDCPDNPVNSPNG
jgi:hypothetical protein